MSIEAMMVDNGEVSTRSWEEVAKVRQYLGNLGMRWKESYLVCGIPITSARRIKPVFMTLDKEIAGIQRVCSDTKANICITLMRGGGSKSYIQQYLRARRIPRSFYTEVLKYVCLQLGYSPIDEILPIEAVIGFEYIRKISGYHLKMVGKRSV